ncbi:hypothetical protein J2S92_003697 [Arthrobacter bambusae]|nr:hypothetical protein [Arthrobacter bambusae]MDQ0237301.1 hypothetical protein [Arthrobacter bambusae]
MNVLLRGGRVVDPGSGLDDNCDVLISGGAVSAVGAVGPVGENTEVIDVSGLIVGPGFVDLHSHVHSIPGQRLQALDGVTTCLDLEAGLMPISKAYEDAAKEGRPLNYGFSASWGSARALVLAGLEPDAQFSSALSMVHNQEWQRSSSPTELSRWLSLLERELADGALGIGVLLGYAPDSKPMEFVKVAQLATKAGVPTFTHVRELVEVDPSTLVDGSSEIAIVAAETGAHMHHCHVNATSGRHIERVLRMLTSSRSAGSRVTVETYPYGAGSTAIGAYFLEPDRLAARGLQPSDIVMLETQERLSGLSQLKHLRETDPAAACVVEFLDERDKADRALILDSMAYPDAIVASDAMPLVMPGRNEDPYMWPLPASATTHPRTTGTFSKTLRLMVRETQAWTWLEAFRRCSYLPARVLDGVAPAAIRKGHLGVGADADVVVIDPANVTDNATYFDSTRPSTGIRHSLVNGKFIVRNGRLELDSFPGKPLRGHRS